MIGYADAGYLSDPYKAMSQIEYVFICGGTTIFWRSQKQILIATSSNHAEVIALHEASRECVWLWSVTQHIQVTCGLPVNRDPTILFEDNVDEERIHQKLPNQAHTPKILLIQPRT